MEQAQVLEKVVRICIPERKLPTIKKYLTMTGDELYDRYGLKRDETITYTVAISEDMQADIKVVICDGDSLPYPYVDGVLFKNGCEVQVLDVREEIEGDWEFDHKGERITVKVLSEEAFAMGYPYPTAYVKIILEKYNYDTEKAHEILCKPYAEVVKEVQNYPFN